MIHMICIQVRPFEDEPCPLVQMTWRCGAIQMEMEHNHDSSSFCLRLLMPFSTKRT